MCFHEDDQEAISGITLGAIVHMEDSKYWFFSKNRKYRIKTGYKVALRQCEGNGNRGVSNQSSQQVFWKRIWKLEVPNKVKLFIWRACSNILPTAVNLFQRKILDSPACTRCGLSCEDSGHALWSCKKN